MTSTIPLKRLLLLGWLLPSLAGAAAPEQKLLESFEQGFTAKLTGTAKAAPAGAATEGAAALQLESDASVSITIAPNSISQPGWLKIDTFNSGKEPATISIEFVGLTLRHAVAPSGKDTLALPMSLVVKGAAGPWPASPTTLVIKNVGQAPLAIDNVRLAAPAQPPAGFSLADFGPADQAPWPGFERVDSDGQCFAWSGRNKLYPTMLPCPDPLTGSYSGPPVSFRITDAVNIQCSSPSVGWLWLTHYSFNCSSSIEYSARLNNKNLLHQLLSRQQMLSPQGLLEGKDQPWTSEWLDKGLANQLVSRVEVELGKGANTLDLANCQLAAAVLAPQNKLTEAKAYVQGLEEELRRFRRQFVLGAQHRPRCEVKPSEDETKAGLMWFCPPRDAWFNRTYTPAAADKAQTLKLIGQAGGEAMAALVAVPLADTANFSASVENLRDAKGTAVAGGIRVHALETVPAVYQAAAFYQPFLPAKAFKAAPANGVCWLLVHVSIPAGTHSGVYVGTLKAAGGKTAAAKLPVELEVAQLPADIAPANFTSGVLEEGNPMGVYWSMACMMNPAQTEQAGREIISQLFAAGANAAVVLGPTLGNPPAASPAEMISGLKRYPVGDARGKGLIQIQTALQQLAGRQIAPGTSLYGQTCAGLVQTSNDLAGKAGLKDYALLLDRTGSSAVLADMVKAASAVRAAGGKPALVTWAHQLPGLAGKAELFKALDTLILYPNAPGMSGLVEEFKKSGTGKTFATVTPNADSFICGLYSWAIGADGIYVAQAFSPMPLYNGFYFDGRSLLLPNEKGGLEPTLNCLTLLAGCSDFSLAKRCEALVKAAKARRIDTQELEAVFAEIKAAADANAPYFTLETWRYNPVSPKQADEWRTKMLQSARKISEQFAR